MRILKGFARSSIMFVGFAIIFALISSADVNSAPIFSGGDGSLGNPYQITTCQQLSLVRNYLDKNFVLNNDLDCTAQGNNIMIGSEGNPYVGKFNGDGHTITVAIDVEEDDVGLFRFIENAEISKLRTGGAVHGNSIVGGVVAFASSSNIFEVTNSADLSGATHIGGIVANLYSGSIVSDSYNTGQISGQINGGVVSDSTSSTIQRSYSNGFISDGMVGGVVCEVSPPSVINSNFSAGHIDRDNGDFGGVIGRVYNGAEISEISNNFWDVSRTSFTVCGWDGESNPINEAGNCEGKNLAWGDSNYFKNTSSSRPFVDAEGNPVWDFETVWEVVDGGYPALRAIIGDGEAINDVATVPGAPANFSVASKGPQTINLSWTASVINVFTSLGGYEITYKLHEDENWTTWPSRTMFTNISINNLFYNSTYDFRVSAFNNIGTSTSELNLVTTTPNTEHIYVDINYSEGNCDDHEWGVDAFNDLEVAMNNVMASSTVHIALGTYETNDEIYIQYPGIKIMGPEPVDFEAMPLIRNIDSDVVFNIEASDVLIKGLKIEQRSGDDYADNYPVVRVGQVTGAHVQENDIAGGTVGVAVNLGAASTTVSGNKIHDNDYGIICWQNLIAISDNIIEHNDWGIGLGVYYGFTRGLDMSGTVVSGNIVRSNTSGGISFASGNQSSSVTIGPGNIITDNPEGIVVQGNSHNLFINGNSIYGSISDDSGLHVSDNISGVDASKNWWGHASGPSETNFNSAGLGDEISITDSNNIWYRPFYTNEAMTNLSVTTASPDNLSLLFGAGTFIVPFGELYTDAHNIEVTENTTISFVSNGGMSSVEIPHDTVISRTDGERMDSSDMSASDIDESTISGLGSGEVIEGALQWGIPEVGLTFNPAITLNIYVGTDLNGQTLSVKRSLSINSGWVDDGIVAPKACVVSSGVCSFQTTKASYFAATKLTQNSGGGGSGGGMSISPVYPSAKVGVLGFKINNGEVETTSPKLTLILNADQTTTRWFAVSTDPNFTNASLQTIVEESTFTLPNIVGPHTVYLKYYSKTGNQSQTFSRDIGLIGSTKEIKSAPANYEKYVFKKTLKLGSRGEDVRQLQRYLNSHGYVVARLGAGSPGKETTTFGSATRAAVIKLQEKNAVEILTPFNLRKGTGIAAKATIKYINKN